MSASTGERKGRATTLTFSLSPAQRDALARRVAERGAAEGRPITTSEYVRDQLFAEDQPLRAA
jgi:hypothetical protein